MDPLLIIICSALIVFFVLFLAKLWGFVYPFLFWGGVYVPTLTDRVEKIIRYLDIKPGDKIVDLGSGDGRLLIAAARAGAKAFGYEICPRLAGIARKKIREAGLENKAFVFRKNLWRQDLGEFDSVVVYGMRHMMKGLEEKFEKELKPGAKVVSNYFALPNWKPESSEDNIYFYVKKSCLDKRI